MIRIGTRMSSHHKTFEVVSIMADGGLRLRPLKPGNRSNGTQYELGERVRIVGVDQDEALEGEVVSVGPIRAVVTQRCRYVGYEVGTSKIRKKEPAK